MQECIRVGSKSLPLLFFIPCSAVSAVAGGALHGH